jgi:hypothetical protein
MFKYADRVKEISTTVGTGTFTLGGAYSGFRTFASVITDGASVYYTAVYGSSWEVGVGVYSNGTLTRSPVASSNANALVNFQAGPKEVFLCFPATAIATVSDEVVGLLPSGNGATDRANLLAALADTPAGGEVILAPGTWYTDAQIVITEEHSNKAIRCRRGVAKWIPTYTSVLGADERTNAVFLLRGTTGAQSTTLNGKLWRNKYAFVATSAVFGATGYVRLRGVNGQYSFPDDSCTAVISQLLQIASAAGTTYTLAQRTFAHHDTGIAAVSITPLTDFQMEGIYVDSDANDTIAAGFHVEDALRIRFDRCGGRNMSRAILTGYGAKSVRDNDTYSNGSSNGGVYLETCQDWVSRGYYRSAEGDRYHVNGTPRPELSMRAMCAMCEFRDFSINHANGGTRLWGGVDSGFDGGRIDDVDTTAIVSRDPIISMYGINTTVGSVFDGGPGPTDPGEQHAEFGFGCYFKNIVATDAYQPNTYVEGSGCCVLYYHDHWTFTAANVQVQNRGRGPLGANNADAKCGGIIVSDFSGIIDNHILRGTEFALWTRNVVTAFRAGRLEWYSTQADSGATVGSWAVQFDHSNGNSSARGAPRIEQLVISSTSAVYRWAIFGNSFAANPDLGVRIGNVLVDGYPWDDVCVMPASGGWGNVWGVFVEYDGTSGAVSTAAGARNLAIAASYPSNGYGMVTKRRGAMLLSGSAPARHGSVVQTATSGYAQAGAIPAAPASYGVAEAFISNNYLIVSLKNQ